MNKKITAFVALLLVFAMMFAFAGCSSTEEEPEETTLAPATPAEELSTEPLTAYDENDQLYYPDPNSPADAEEPQTLAEKDVHFYEEGAADTLVRNEVNLKYFLERFAALADGTEKAAITHEQGRNIGKQSFIVKNDKGEDEEQKYKYTGSADKDFEDSNEVINASVDTVKKYMLDPQNQNKEEVKYPATAAQVKEMMPWADALLKVTANDVKAVTVVDAGTTRTLTITFKDDYAALADCFDTEDVDYIWSEIEKANAYVTVDKAGTQTKFYGCSIRVNIDIPTDNITYIECNKVMDINTTVTGVGTLASVGTLPFQYRYTFTNKYSFNTVDPNAPVEE